MTMTDTAPAPRRSTLPKDVADALAREEYRRCADAVAALDDADWAQPTDCALWTVRELVAHMVGMAVMASSPVQTFKQVRAAGKRHQPGTQFVDELTAVQVELFGSKSPQELVRLMAWVGPRAARGRRRTPGLMRSRTAPDRPRINGVEEPWTIGYMMATILTRDPWMHRIDLARATGRDLVLTEDHDGVIVADVVTEWAGRHGLPYRLTLTGPAGGTWSSAAGGEEITMDAVEFCRAVSGRASRTGLLETEVPF